MVEGGDYEPLLKAIKSYGTWAHINESTWAVVSEKTAPDIRDHLGKFFPSGSRLFVIKSGVAAAWKNTICSNEWLKKNL